MYLLYFNSHTREGVTDRSWKITFGKNFNTHTREGVTKIIACNYQQLSISTHTPVRVWPFQGWNPEETCRFQLTHPWGCDINLNLGCRLMTKFQLTHPWGCDIDTGDTINAFRISTHTPVRVWLKKGSIGFTFFHFNSHTREGVTYTINATKSQGKFQLTHPWGCDLVPTCLFYFE